MLNWIFAGAALGFFAICSFWVYGLASKIRKNLGERHPDTLRQIQPSDSASFMEHWIWQNAFNAAWAALPLIKQLDDVPLRRDASMLRTATIVSFVAWATTVAAFWIALTQPQ